LIPKKRFRPVAGVIALNIKRKFIVELRRELLKSIHFFRNTLFLCFQKILNVGRRADQLKLYQSQIPSFKVP